MALRFAFVAVGCKVVFATITYVKSLPTHGASYLQKAAILRNANDDAPLTRNFDRQYILGEWAKDIYGTEQTENHPHVSLAYQHMSFTPSGETTGQKFLLHHIWKCGGTHLCEVARQSGLLAPVNDGCHRWLDEAANRWAPCAVTPTMNSSLYNVIGHECPVNEGVIKTAALQGFKWVEVLRDPIEQAASWYMHAVRGNYVASGNLTEWLRMSETANPGFYKFKPNLQVGWLGGCGENITLDCFKTALANLEQMDVVLEQKGETLFGTDKLVKLGWQFPDDSTKQDYTSKAQTYINNMPSSERKLLEKLQEYDLKLMEVARTRGLI